MAAGLWVLVILGSLSLVALLYGLWLLLTGQFWDTSEADLRRAYADDMAMRWESEDHPYAYAVRLTADGHFKVRRIQS